MRIGIGVGLVVLTILVVLGFVFLRKPAPVAQKSVSELEQSQDDLDAIPTTGPEVKVSIVSVQPKKEIKLVVEGVPSGTSALEYELTYSTAEQDAEGVFSTAKPDKGSTTFGTKFERQITLGTCSRNVCRYHVITSPVKVILKFEGSYGARILQKEFDQTVL